MAAYWLRKIALLLALFSISLSSSAELKVMTINAEWLWTPHDRKADGSRFNKGDLSPQAYDEELSFYARLIKREKAQLVALSEIENNLVAEDLARMLGAEWRAFFKQGRDTATGQDVALLSSLAYVPDSVTDFGFPSGRLPSDKYGSKGKRLSKVVGAKFVLDHRSDEASILGVVTSHFLSKRNDSKKKSANRLRQAHALGIAIEKYKEASERLIVLGDLNDYLHSEPIRYLIKEHMLGSVEQLCSERDRRYVIDHILFYGLECIRSYHVDLSQYSDHDGVVAIFR